MAIHLKINFEKAPSSLSKIHLRWMTKRKNRTSKMKTETVGNCIFHKKFHFSITTSFSNVYVMPLFSRISSVYSACFYIWDYRIDVGGHVPVTFYFLGLTDFLLYHSSLLQFLSGQQKIWMLVFRNFSLILLLKFWVQQSIKRLSFRML